MKEFQVNSNSFSAEYGRAGGAVINVVTKSGTNDLRGSVFEFYRDKALNANNAINELNNRPKSPYHYNQFGGTLGGPIRRNRDFFFFNYDGQRNTQPNVVFLNLPATTPPTPATAAGIARLQPLADSWNRRLDQDVFLIKTDHALNDRNRLTLRYNHQNFTGEGFENGGTAELVRAHRRVDRADADVQRQLDAASRPRRLQRAAVPVGARQRAGPRQQRRTPRRSCRRPARRS